MRLNTPAMAVAFGILGRLPASCRPNQHDLAQLWAGASSALRLNLSRLPPWHWLGLSGHWNDLRLDRWCYRRSNLRWALHRFVGE